MQIKPCANCGVTIRVTPKKQRPLNYCSMACVLAGRTRPLADRFWDLVRREESCWRWVGSLSTAGYGQIYRKDTGKPDRAHRVSYFLAHGVYPPKGLPVHHICHHSWCVNPDHLEVVASRAEHFWLHPVTSKPGHYVNRVVCEYGHPITGDGAYFYKSPKGVRRICKICHRRRAAKWKAKYRGTPGHRAQLDRKNERRRKSPHAADGPKLPV